MAGCPVNLHYLDAEDGTDGGSPALSEASDDATEPQSRL
jgi:hypothetical protein